MAILLKIKSYEMSFLEAVNCSENGDTIVIDKEPRGIESSSTLFAHTLGVLSVIEGNVYLNNTLICSNNVKETHGIDFFPFYDKILIYRKSGVGGSTMHEFYWMSPHNIEKPVKNGTVTPNPAFRLEAEELNVVPLSSGKGLILIESKPNQRILLLKKLRMFGTIWNKISVKDVDVAWKGPHVQYAETPTSVVVGAEELTANGIVVTKFLRGHGKKRIAVHEHIGTNLATIYATDDDFFYESQMHDEKCIISKTSGKVVYHGTSGELYTTSTALVRIKDTTVEANGIAVTDSFVRPNWIKPCAHGLMYGLSGEIRMLVIK